MSKSFVDAYDLMREECKRITNNRFLKCSDCRVKWICNNIHSPVPGQWKELDKSQINALGKD